MANTSKESLVRRRPTESATFTTATVAALLTSTFDLAPREAAAVTFLVGVLAPTYTFLVDHGGLIGFVGELWHGHIARPTEAPSDPVPRRRSREPSDKSLTPRASPR
jgi:hypothetical protein